MTPGLAGQIITGTVSLGVIGFGISEAVLALVQSRTKQRIEAQEVLRAKIDQFTGQYGQRSEDPDDQPYEAAS